LKKCDHLFSDIFPHQQVSAAPAVIPQQPASNGLKPTDLIHATGTWADTNLKE
jgi:hypothetical protein